jgi:hypothetical protein
VPYAHKRNGPHHQRETGPAHTLDAGLATVRMRSTTVAPRLLCVDCGHVITFRERSGWRKYAWRDRPSGPLCGPCDDQRTGGPLP